MTYRVTHRTEYRYDSVVSSSYGEARLHPRETPWQQCYSASVSIEPFPEDYRERRDFFGNRVAGYAIIEAHSSLVVTSTSVVDVRSAPASVLDASLPWEAARDGLDDRPEAEVLDARQYVLASPAVPMSPRAAEFVRSSFAPGRALREVLADVAHRITSGFEYAPGATTVSTGIDTVLDQRAGVCQDFAHLAIAGFRSMGLAARYVSGYLETRPPPGTPRLQGADGSHAWVSVFVPGHGWIDVDPTNDQFTNDRYVTVAWGRDYADVPPIKGVIFTEGSSHELHVSVDVVALTADDPALVGR